MPDAAARLPIVDAHHHIWDLALKAHPWLVDEPPIAVPLRRLRTHPPQLSAGRLPPRQPALRRRQDRVRRGRVEPAAIRSARRAGCTKWRSGTACRTPWWRRPGSTAPMQPTCWHSRRRSRWSGACGTSRDRPCGGRTPGAASPARWTVPSGASGFALLAKHGLHFDLQTPWWHFDAAAELARDFPGTIIIVNHTGLPADRSAEGLAGWRERHGAAGAAQPNVMLKISGLGVPGHRWTPRAAGPGGARCDRHLRGGARHVRLQLPRRLAGCHVRRDLRQLSGDHPGHAGRRAPAGCSTTMPCASTVCERKDQP